MSSKVKFQALRFDNLMRQRDEVGLELLRLPLLASCTSTCMTRRCSYSHAPFAFDDERVMPMLS